MSSRQPAHHPHSAFIPHSRADRRRAGGERRQWLKIKQPAKAQEHLARPEKICGKNCEEYKDLAKGIADYKL